MASTARSLAGGEKKATTGSTAGKHHFRSLAQQWGLQIDVGAGSDLGIGSYNVDAQLFWRDPSIGLLGAFASYSHDNGVDDPIFGHISENTQRSQWKASYT